MNKGKRRLSADPLFAAANSGKGFVSFYADIFNSRLEKRYIIKGGPGTGKSSFMKRVAEAAEAKGYSVDRYMCSSDPESLDGVVIDDRIAVLDGTAPHSMDAELPGARDEIVNLGEFWNSDILVSRRDEIERLGSEKSCLYRKAYRFLEACENIFRINRSLILPTVRHEKLQRAAKRALEGVPNGDKYFLRTGLVDSVGMKGRVRFDTYERKAKRLYCVREHYGSGALFLRAVIVNADMKSCPICVSYDPVHLSEPNAVFFEHTGDCFVLTDEKDMLDGDGEINMKRFVNGEALRNVRSEYRCNMRVYDAMLSAACEALSEAGESHFALERIYAGAMDFSALGAFTDRFIERLL